DFFFSSSRRHTRFSRDWSSDVCSSDLMSRLATTPGKRLVIPLSSIAWGDESMVFLLRGCGQGRARRATGRSPLGGRRSPQGARRSEEHTSELQSRENLVCRLLLEKKKN